MPIGEHRILTDGFIQDIILLAQRAGEYESLIKRVDDLEIENNNLKKENAKLKKNLAKVEAINKEYAEKSTAALKEE